jgi:hypothetical protein
LSCLDGLNTLVLPLEVKRDRLFVQFVFIRYRQFSLKLQRFFSAYRLHSACAVSADVSSLIQLHSCARDGK